jgi:ABC-type transport system substrate-binding protein
MKGYWEQTLTRRISRRRALAATGGTAAAAAFLAACGGSDSGGGGGEGGSAGLLAQPVDTLKEAKRGGLMKDRIHGDVATFDPFTPNNTLNAIEGMTNSSLVQFKPGYMKPSENEIAPDLAESWETSPDGLTVTLKIRQGVKFHNKPPVNGRALDIDDVIFSWKRFEQKSSTRAGVANSASPDAPVLSITATDARTIVMKLKEPIIHALGLFTSNSTGGTVIMPKETDSTFDPRGDTISTGPFYLSNYQPSIGFTLKRHPDYWDKDAALVDTVEKPIITEYSSVLSQFKAGNIYSFGSYLSGPQITADDVLPTKRDDPRIQIYQGEYAGAGLIGSRMGFGWLPEGKSPFVDERVRQAISLSWDRDAYLETFFNVSRFEAEGLPVATRYHTALVATFHGWWLDPQSKDFGPNAKYFKYDLSEAKKLLAAAGFANGFEATSHYVTGPELSLTPKHAEVMDGFHRELGIKVNQHSIDYTKEYIPLYRDGKGQYEGWTYTSTAGSPTGGEAIVELANQYWSKAGSAAYVGMSVNGKNDQSGDPQLDALFEKGRLERDTEKRRAVVYDIQRYLAKPSYALRLPGMARAFLVAWPCIGNFQLYEGARQNHQWWIDDTKAPIAKT